MATNSGSRRLVHGTRERILSSDHNREQAFVAAMVADAYRYLFDADTSEDEAAGVATVGLALGNPLRAVIFNGLRVRPEVGTFNVFVDAGMGLFVDPGSPASPDDAVAQVVRSGGQQVAGALLIGAAGGSTRIDVIECSITQTVVETDNRDVFNQSTGSFTPQLMNKVVEAQLTFRVRAGTPGGGFPGTASGWLPLAVASVPSGATNNDACTFWDVRPLLSDFARAPHQVRAAFPTARRRHTYATDDGSGNWNVKGIVELELAGRRVGGNLCPTASGATALRVDSGGGLQEPGFAVVNNLPWYLYLAFPFGLPRWAKYSPSSGGARVPLSPRGIPVFTQKVPAGLSGIAGSAISLPSATGLGGSTSNAIVAVAGQFEGPFFGASMGGAITESIARVAITPSSGNNTANPIYTLTAGVHFPTHAVAICVASWVKVTLAAGTITVLNRDVQLRNTGLTELYSAFQLYSSFAMPSAGNVTDTVECWLQVPPNLPSGVAASFKVQVEYLSLGTYSEEKIFVKGWQLP